MTHRQDWRYWYTLTANNIPWMRMSRKAKPKVVRLLVTWTVHLVRRLVRRKAPLPSDSADPVASSLQFSWPVICQTNQLVSSMESEGAGERKVDKSADVGVACGAAGPNENRKEKVSTSFHGKIRRKGRVDTFARLIDNWICWIEYFPSFLACTLIGGGTALRRPVKASAWKHDNRNTLAGESPFSL